MIYLSSAKDGIAGGEERSRHTILLDSISNAVNLFLSNKEATEESVTFKRVV